MDGDLESEDLVPLRDLTGMAAAHAMKRERWPVIRHSALGLVIAGVELCTGCAGGPVEPVTPSPSPTAAQAPAARTHFDLSVVDAVAYFERYSMECVGPNEPFVDSREWLCVQDNVTSANTARIIGDAAGVSQLIGISEGGSPEDAISFLLGVVVAAVVPEAEATGMTYRAVSQPGLPGAWHLDSASVELQAHSNARAVMVDPPEPPRDG